MSLLQYYQQQLQINGFDRDAYQERILLAFDRLADQLTQPRKTSGWLWKKSVPAVQGLYIWGGVGRGKTWLMDLFHQQHETLGIERHHFHSFMRLIHQRLKEHEGDKEPMMLIAHEMENRMRVLCLDEFNVIDIGDAMLMRTLLESLQKVGITLVTTSNQPPDNLYMNGLQRERFLPAIALLKSGNEVLELEGDQDYRLQLFETSSVYHTPLSDDAMVKLSGEFDRLASGSVEEMGRFEVPGRAVRFVKRASGVIWSDFNALCGPPRWQNDYIELARCHHTVFISDIPRLDGTWDDRTRRFINLVDVFYDQKVKVVISADAEPDRLYSGTRLAFEFKRTASRLKEMQSAKYLETPHKG
ncbi:MAG: cell division protein ZapE [Candidatus Thiodiazotropha sp. 6PLUC2]